MACVTNIEARPDGTTGRLTVWRHERRSGPYFELFVNSVPTDPHQIDGDALFQALSLELDRLGSEVGRLRRRELDRERAASATGELGQACRTVLDGFEDGVFRRSVDGDADPHWALKLLPSLAALATMAKVAGWEARSAESAVVEAAMLYVPVDDEPEMPGERGAVEEALRDVREGRTISHEEALRRLGLAADGLTEAVRDAERAETAEILLAKRRKLAVALREMTARYETTSEELWALQSAAILLDPDSGEAL